MPKHYVALFDCDFLAEHYDRGDIFVIEWGAGPPGVGWVSFDPPPELRGTPQLTHVHDDGNGSLIFEY
jgi:hypothetical protein